MTNSFDARQSLQVGDADYRIYRLDRVGAAVDDLPYTLKVLLENLLRHEDGVNVTADDIKALAAWDPQAEPSREIAFTPARVILQDFTGVRRPRRQRVGDQPAIAGGAGHRSFRSSRQLRHDRRAGRQQRDRIQA
jgi:aconitase A